jgi:hypothetical protein
MVPADKISGEKERSTPRIKSVFKGANTGGNGGVTGSGLDVLLQALMSATKPRKIKARFI